ncbi:hypothetical protein SK128_002561 [Halocaridina rubra]|uniref:Uncharacterized protein n=1 Tax=Halocaridina rubra TaxID=373956 RepID=A0AAN9A5C2_HALRR
MKYLRNRRAHHTKIVKAELEEVEAVRKSYHIAKKSSVEAPPPSNNPPSVTSPPTSEDEEDIDEHNPCEGCAGEEDITKWSLKDKSESNSVKDITENDEPAEEITHI